MARRPSKHLRPARPLLGTIRRMEVKADGGWVVQPIADGRSEKTYVCPGCHRAIPVGVSHIVSWPQVPQLAFASPVEERRHWHTSCWTRRR